MVRSKMFLVFVGLCLLCSVWSRPAYAYLDPGTGSFLLQIIIAFLLGSAFAVKIYWRKIRNFFVNLFSKNKKKEKND